MLPDAPGAVRPVMRGKELTVGVLGGMGPDATVDFMAKVIAMTPAERDQDHLRMLVDHNPKVPNRQQAIRGEGPDAGPALAAMAAGLERAGADFLVMVCNSAHAFIEAIEAAVQIPLVSIIDVTVQEIGRIAPEARRVGLLATDGLLQSGIYQRALGDSGLELLVPSADDEASLMSWIGRIKGGDRQAAVASGVRSQADKLVARGADALIAGCTEIPLVLSADDVDIPLVSSTDVLARRVVEYVRGAPLLLRAG